MLWWWVIEEQEIIYFTFERNLVWWDSKVGEFDCVGSDVRSILDTIEHINERSDMIRSFYHSIRSDIFRKVIRKKRFFCPKFVDCFLKFFEWLLFIVSTLLYQHIRQKT